MIKKILITATALVFGQLVMSQTKQVPLSDSLLNVKGTSSIKPYNTVITKNAKTSVGLFTVHKVDEKYYFEIADSILGRDILVVSRLAKAAADMRGRGSMSGYAGDELNENVLRFEKGLNNKIYVRNLSYSERSADSTKPMYKAVMNSTIQPIVLSFDVKANRKDSISGASNYVIDMTDIINSDNDLFFFGPSKQSMHIGGYQPDKSYALDVKTYPLNTEIKTIKTYTRAPLGMASFNGSTPTPVGPTGNLTVELNTSMVLLPKEPMAIRYADDRVGYFTTDYTDFDANPQGIKLQSAIERWRLEPKDADLEKYKRGELVEPKKQIVIYIDPATPAKWVPYLIQGINDWNIAFEKAGFKNAIVGKKAPTAKEDSTWSLEDARHSALVYKPSSVPNASGPHVTDPRSGEVIETHINWYHNLMKLVHDWYFVQAAAVDTQARSMQFNDELMGQLIRFVSSHEVGHTLGLLHNFGASSATPVEKLRDNNWLTANGHTSSIMDYARFNYVAQPEDKISQSNMFPRIGDYDVWAIEWGYKLIPSAKTPEEETPILNKWVIEKNKNKRLWFGSERSRVDPRAQSEDLGDNAMKASEYGIKNLKRIIPNLAKWTKVADDGYGNLQEMYVEVVRQLNRYVGHVGRNIGGRYETLKSVEQSGPIYEIVPAAIQKEAVEFYNKQIFETPTWLINSDLTDYIGHSPISMINSLQDYAFSNVLDNGVLNNMLVAEATNDKAYKVLDLFKDVQKGIWSELSTKKAITIYRRNLQKVYVEKLIGIIKPQSTSLAAFAGAKSGGSTSPTDVVSIAKKQLQDLKDNIKTALPTMPDEMSKIHLKDVVERITVALSVKGE